MTNVAKHRIKQQVLDIHIENVDNQEEVVMAISKVYKDSIEDIITDICDTLIPAKELVRIDTLTIDIGHLEFDRLATDFPKAVKNALRETLFKQIREKMVSPIPLEKAVHQNKENALFYYLSTGQLPWYYEGGLQNLRSEYGTKQIIAKPELIKILRNKENRKRAVEFFKENQLLNFLKGELPMSQQGILAHLQVFKNCLHRLGGDLPLKDGIIANTSKSLLNALKPGREVYSLVMEQLLEELVVPSSASAIHLSDVLPIAYRKTVLSLLKTVEWKTGDLFSEEEVQLMETLDSPHRVRSKKEVRVGLVKKRIETPKELGIESGIAIQNAGLILVWPYLEAFFTGLGLMQEQTFLDDGAITKAIHLLHFMVYKAEEGNETQWLMNKILCGVGPTDFISDKFHLNNTEKQECDHLLRALIANWPALKNTGPDSLRQAFLQRDGLLMPIDNGWLLKVERKGLDVLLDRLSWPISVIKMPWNQYLINVEW